MLYSPSSVHDNSNRFVILASLPSKLADAVDDVLVSHVFCLLLQTVWFWKNRIKLKKESYMQYVTSMIQNKLSPSRIIPQQTVWLKELAGNLLKY